MMEVTQIYEGDSPLDDIDDLIRKVWDACAVMPTVMFVPARFFKKAVALLKLARPLPKYRGARGRKRAICWKR